MLTESKKKKTFFFYQCYPSLKTGTYFVSIFSTYTLAALRYAGNITVEGV